MAGGTHRIISQNSSYSDVRFMAIYYSYKMISAITTYVVIDNTEYNMVLKIGNNTWGTYVYEHTFVYNSQVYFFCVLQHFPDFYQNFTRLFMTTLFFRFLCRVSIFLYSV